MEELRQAFADPKRILKRVQTSSGPVARKLLYAQLRPQLETPMKEHGLVWEDVVPILEELDSLEDLRKAVVRDRWLGKQLALRGRDGEALAKGQTLPVPDSP